MPSRECLTSDQVTKFKNRIDDAIKNVGNLMHQHFKETGQGYDQNVGQRLEADLARFRDGLTAVVNEESLQVSLNQCNFVGHSGPIMRRAILDAFRGVGGIIINSNNTASSRSDIVGSGNNHRWSERGLRKKDPRDDLGDPDRIPAHLR